MAAASLKMHNIKAGRMKYRGKKKKKSAKIHAFFSFFCMTFNFKGGLVHLRSELFRFHIFLAFFIRCRCSHQGCCADWNFGHVLNCAGFVSVAETF